LAEWFDHCCTLYDTSYEPDILIYPEIYQPYVRGKFHICLALGKNAPIRPHADLVICRSQEIVEWVQDQNPNLKTVLILPSIDRRIFEYDGRPKQDVICYMTRPHKHPETAGYLRDMYRDKVMEIIDAHEKQVAEALRNAKVFVWRGHEYEGSPRPPKEALVAGCVVVGLASDLSEKQHINFGIRCASEEELIKMAGEALDMPVPLDEQRAVVRDSKEEKRDWLEVLGNIKIRRNVVSWFTKAFEKRGSFLENMEF
jgi:hypothetical protein